MIGQYNRNQYHDKWPGYPAGTFGAVEEPGYTQLTSQFLTDVAPHLESFSAVSETITDPVRQIAVLESQLQAARASGASLSRIIMLEGKLNAAKIRLQRRQEGDTSVRMWRNLGMLGGGAGIVLLGAITFAVLNRSLAR